MAVMNTTSYYNTTLIGENDTTTMLPLPSTEMWYWRMGLFAVGGACIECVGVICNIISIIVLANFRSSSSAPFLLICLSVFDSIYLLLMLFLEGLALMEGGEVINIGYREFVTPIVAVLFATPFLMQTCTIYLVVIITMERFAVVAWPFVAYRLCNLRSASLAVAAIILFGILYHIPTYKAYTLVAEWDNYTGNWTKKLLANDFGKSTFYTEIYITWMNIIVNFALPFLLLAVFNYLMIMSLRRSRQMAAVSRAFTLEERRLTIMVICMTSIFFVCELLAAISQIVLIGFATYDEPSIAVNRFSAVADTLLLLNAAVNFAIYCVSGRKFRQTFVQLFCQCRNKSHKKPAFAATSGRRHDYSNPGVNAGVNQARPPRRSTTESSLSSISTGTRSSSISAGTRSSRFTSSDSIHMKLSARTTGEG